MLVPLDMNWTGPAQMCSCTVVQHGMDYLVTTSTGAAFKVQSKYINTFVRR